MFLKMIFTKWLESLEIFSKKDLALFFLASLNALRRSVIVLVQKCWWLLVLLLLLKSDSFWVVNRLFYEPSLLKRLFVVDSLVAVGYIFASLLLSFFAFLIVRPSVENKELSYFVVYTNKFLGFSLIALFIGGIPVLPIFWMMALFFMDSQGKIESLYYSFLNSLKLVFYYLPVCAVLGLGKIALDYIVVNLMKFLEAGITSVIGTDGILFLIWDKIFYSILFLVWLFFLCIMTTYYVRIKHKDFKLFTNN